MNNDNEYHNIDAMFASHFSGKEVEMKDKAVFWSQLESKRKEDSWRTWMLILPLLGILGIMGGFDNTLPLNTETVTEPVIKPFIDGDAPSNPPTQEKIALLNDEEKQEEAPLSVSIKRDLSKPEGKVSKTGNTLAIQSAPQPLRSGEPDTRTSLTNEKTSIAIDRPERELPQWIHLNTANPEILNIDTDKTLNEPIALPEKTKWSKCEVKSKGNWFVDVYGQGVRVLENMESTADTRPYLNEYEEKFDPANGMMAGAMVGYKFPVGIMLYGGLEYQRYQSKYESITRVFTTERIYDPMAYFTIDDDGNRIYVGDTVTLTTITDREETIANTTTLINIPLHLGYQKAQNDWRWGIDAGVIFNIRKEYDGVHLLPDGSLTVLDKDNYDNFMTTKTGISLSAGVSIGRMLTDQLELYVSPRFRYNNQNNFKDEIHLSLKNNFAGLRAGVRYYFD